jgi:plastocyanin
MPIRAKISRREVLASCFVSLASPSWGANPQVHRIGVHKLAFGPAPDGLDVNDIVEWTNSDILRHTATATDGSFDIDLPGGATGRTILKRVSGVTSICRFQAIDHGKQGRADVATTHAEAALTHMEQAK